jgi:hypothetical protein
MSLISINQAVVVMSQNQVVVGFALCTCSDRSTNNPVGYSASPMLITRNITLFGQWPASLGNGLLG